MSISNAVTKNENFDVETESTEIVENALTNDESISEDKDMYDASAKSLDATQLT